MTLVDPHGNRINVAAVAAADARAEYESLNLREIAARIDEHLKRFQADPEINTETTVDPQRPGGGLKRFYHAAAYHAGRYCNVVYVSYQRTSLLSKAAALAYLEWLDAGNVGRHYEQQREAM